LERDRHVGQCEAGDMRVAAVEVLLHVLQRRTTAEECTSRHAADARGRYAGAGESRVEARDDRLTRVWRSWTGGDEQRSGAVLPRGERLVAEVRIARQDTLGLLIRVLGEVAQDENDFVFDVEPGVAVVAEVLRFGHHDAVAREDD